MTCIASCILLHYLNLEEENYQISCAEILVFKLNICMFDENYGSLQLSLHHFIFIFLCLFVSVAYLTCLCTLLILASDLTFIFHQVALNSRVTLRYSFDKKGIKSFRQRQQNHFSNKLKLTYREEILV